MMRVPAEKDDEQTVLGGAQLILAEKRTALSVLRTGIGVFALPMGVLSLLVASSRYYRVGDVLHLFLPLLGLCLALVVLGSYLVLRSIRRIHHYDRVLNELKSRHPAIGQYIE
jgi:uncharacterized membrane protein YidH (DUF202 family)